MSREVARVDWRGHPEYGELMAREVPGMGLSHAIDAFEGAFGIRLRRSQAKSWAMAHGVSVGVPGGRFTKGRVSWNRGMRAEEYMSPEALERTRSTRFRKGEVSGWALRYPLGAERVTAAGVVEVKVHLRSPKGPCTNGCWVSKARVVWERAHGRPFPERSKAVFADGDNRNFDPANVVAVPNRAWAIIAARGWRYSDAETLLACVARAELLSAAHRAEVAAPRRCSTCGAEFVPGFDRQANCRACIDSGRPLRRRASGRGRWTDGQE